MNNLQSVERVRSSVWAMRADAFGPLVESGAIPIEVDVSVSIDIEEFETEPDIRTEAPACDLAKVPRLPKSNGSVAVIPIRGTIGQHRGDYWADTYTDSLMSQIAQMQAAPSVGSIVLDIDSPGGIVYGTPELARSMRDIRAAGGKPIYAVANSQAFSAAYFIASAASKVFVTPSGKVGSIGVWNMHIDQSKMLEEAGLTVSTVSAGKHKLEGSPFGPLEDEARAEMQRSVDSYYDDFLGAVAAGRGVSKATVRETFGEGRMVEAERAKNLGMVDGVATLNEVLAGIIPPKRTGSRQNTVAGRLAIEGAR